MKDGPVICGLWFSYYRTGCALARCVMSLWCLEPCHVTLTKLKRDKWINKLGDKQLEFSCNSLYHRRAVAQPCVNGDRLSKGRMAKFDPAQIRNPWTDRHKIWKGDYVGETTPRAKFRANPSIGGLSANGSNITKIFIWYIYLFCWPTCRSDRPADFHARWLGQRGLTQGPNLFGNRNSKLISNHWKNLPKSKVSPKKRT